MKRQQERKYVRKTMRDTPWNRRTFLKASAAAYAPALLGSGIPSRLCAQTDNRPNIVLVFVDDLGYGDLGCYGQEKILTPNIDKMASEGIRFTQNYCGGATCHPSRGTLLTGCHQGNPNRELPGFNRDTNQAEYVPLTLGGMMQSAGYATCHIGKWGGMSWMCSRGPKGPKWCDPVHWGFDYCCGNLNHSETSYYTGNIWEITPTRATEIPNSSSSYGCDVMLEKSMQWLDRNAKNDKPFFLYYAHNLIHGPKHYPPDEEINSYYRNMPWEDERLRQYGAMTTKLDKDMGAIVKKLRHLGVVDNTIILFTSDQGPTEDGPTTGFFHSGGPLRGNKRSIYEGCFRVPMIVWGPGIIPSGKVSDYVWAHWDILPTCADIAGVAPPSGISGRSILPTLRGHEQEAVHDYLYFTYKGEAVRSGKWKLYKKEDGTFELYDLEADGGETRNSISEHPDIVTKLSGYLENPNQDMIGNSTPADPDSAFLVKKRRRDIRMTCRAGGTIEVFAHGNTPYSIILHELRGRTLWRGSTMTARKFVIPKKLKPGKYIATVWCAGTTQTVPIVINGM